MIQSSHIHRILFSIVTQVITSLFSTFTSLSSAGKPKVASQGAANQDSKQQSKYLGVSWRKQDKRWVAQLVINRKPVLVKTFASEEVCKGFDDQSIYDAWTVCDSAHDK